MVRRGFEVFDQNRLAAYAQEKTKNRNKHFIPLNILTYLMFKMLN
jgi:hypothetical protein